MDFTCVCDMKDEMTQPLALINFQLMSKFWWAKKSNNWNKMIMIGTRLFLWAVNKDKYYENTSIHLC